MVEKEPSRLPAGRPPWDPWNGARVGVLVGGLVGVGATFAVSAASFWLVPIGAAIGGATGYRIEKRKQQVVSPGESSKEDNTN